MEWAENNPYCLLSPWACVSVWYTLIIADLGYVTGSERELKWDVKSNAVQSPSNGWGLKVPVDVLRTKLLVSCILSKYWVDVIILLATGVESKPSLSANTTLEPVPDKSCTFEDVDVRDTAVTVPLNVTSPEISPPN